ncbi:MAG: heparinase II/III family protein [Planctomycetia bacterium]|nr:heparinase II/III family protein [Planctomycetia bacterium]
MILCCLLYGGFNFLWAADPIFEAEDAILGTEVSAVQKDLFPSKKGVVRKTEPRKNSKLNRSDFKVDFSRPADLIFHLDNKKPGKYTIYTTAAVDELTAQYLEKARSKMDSISLMISVDGGLPSSRVVVPAWRKGNLWTYGLGVFDFKQSKTEVRIWLAEGVILDEIHIRPHSAPKVPPAAAEYRPEIVPPKDHPRLWFTPESLPAFRENLTKGENAEVWKQIQKEAAAPFKYKYLENCAVDHNESLLRYVQKNAFVWQMIGDKKYGRRAVDLIIPYLSRVEYGNMQDITRELGDSIYTGALVFDWCNSLLSDAEKKAIYDAQIRLSYHMETGWPPFKQSILIGHGNEGQILKHFLAMSIAFYEIDPVPYQYCTWRIFEDLVPMRRFEYQSPRHNQGIAYIGARLQWEYYAALMFKRMVSKEIFDPNIKGIRDYLLFMRLPNGEMFRDGDVYLSGFWWAFPGLALTQYSYAEDPVMKGEYFRQKKWKSDPLLFLLLNDPDLKADSTFDTLPLAYDSGKILCSQILRTGWNFGPESEDTIVEFKGGNYQFGNHQHADSGAFQVYHRGLLAADLGLYRFYGTVYDNNFNKRSISHNVMLVYDPSEVFYKGGINDGGQRFIMHKHPGSPERTESDPMFKSGTLLDSRILPSRENPQVSFFTVDLTSAYSGKVEKYIRSFCWIRTGRKDVPVAVIVYDRLTASDPSFKKYWQLNTLTKPEPITGGGWSALTLENLGADKKPCKRGELRLRTLVPGPDKIQCDLIGGDKANSVFGTPLPAPKDAPESTGWRIMLTPKKAAKTDQFLNLILVGDEGAQELPVQWEKSGENFRIQIAGKSVILDPDGHFELE